jgi:hypothetical protein
MHVRDSRVRRKTRRNGAQKEPSMKTLPNKNQFVIHIFDGTHNGQLWALRVTTVLRAIPIAHDRSGERVPTKNPEDSLDGHVPEKHEH